MLPARERPSQQLPKKMPPSRPPAAMTVAETAEEDLAQVKVGASTPTMGDEAVGTPPLSSVAEEGDKVSTPPPSEEVRAPTPAPAGASTPEGSPSRGKDPMIPVTVAGGSAEGEEAQAASDDEVEEIQGRPHDGRQHVYVWRQRGDHWASHKEIAETEEAARVEHAAKWLVDEVNVGGLMFCWSMYILLLVHYVICIFLAGCNENGEVPKKVLPPNRRCGCREQGLDRRGGPPSTGGRKGGV